MRATLIHEVIEPTCFPNAGLPGKLQAPTLLECFMEFVCQIFSFLAAYIDNIIVSVCHYDSTHKLLGV